MVRSTRALVLPFSDGQLPLQAAKTCELHVHLYGGLFAADLLALGRDYYEKIDWSLFVDSFERAYGKRPDPVALFGEALHTQCLDPIEAHYVYGVDDGGDFARFQAKFNMAICIYRHWWKGLDKSEEIWRRVLAHHRREGLRYVEYRVMAPYDHAQPEAFVQFHQLIARFLQQASTADFEARYLISLPRWAPLECYQLVQRLLDENEDLIPAVVGLDFCHFEEGYPPARTRAFFRRLRRDNELRPERAPRRGLSRGRSVLRQIARKRGALVPRSGRARCAPLGALHGARARPGGCRGPPAPSPRMRADQRTLGPDCLRLAPRGRIAGLRRPG